MLHVCKTGIALYTFIVSKIFCIRIACAAFYAHILALIFGICKTGIAFYAHFLSLIFRVNRTRAAFTCTLRVCARRMAAWCLRVGNLNGGGEQGYGAQGNVTKAKECDGRDNERTFHYGLLGRFSGILSS